MDPGLPDTFTKRVFEARNGDLYFIVGNHQFGGRLRRKIVATNGAPTWSWAWRRGRQGVVVSVAANCIGAGTNYFPPTPQNPCAAGFLLDQQPGVPAGWRHLGACGNAFFRIKDGVWHIGRGRKDWWMQRANGD